MAFEHYIYSGTKRLRCGYTTGSCAALAAKAAVKMLLGQKRIIKESLETPSGIKVEVDIIEPSFAENSASCGVVKDGGDDYDATDGLLVCAEVKFSQLTGIHIDGGVGVGRVTMPGLDQQEGMAAINRIPRQMIAKEVQSVTDSFGVKAGIDVIISVPEGEKAARRTFNKNLGIVGGISILGTTGIVEPRSLNALKESIELEIKQQSALGIKSLIVTPGNYGQEFLAGYPKLQSVPGVSCANFIGDTLDFAARYEFDRLLLVGHIGKLVKIAGSIMDTHSRMADCRNEIFCAHAALAGAGQETALQLMQAATTDACLQILECEDLTKTVLNSLSDALQERLEHRVAGAFQIGAIVFSNQYGELFKTHGTDQLIETMEEMYG